MSSSAVADCRDGNHSLILLCKRQKHLNQFEPYVFRSVVFCVFAEWWIVDALLLLCVLFMINAQFLAELNRALGFEQ